MSTRHYLLICLPPCFYHNKYPRHSVRGRTILILRRTHGKPACGLLLADSQSFQGWNGGKGGGRWAGGGGGGSGATAILCRSLPCLDHVDCCASRQRTDVAGEEPSCKGRSAPERPWLCRTAMCSLRLLCEGQKGCEAARGSTRLGVSMEASARTPGMRWGLGRPGSVCMSEACRRRQRTPPHICGPVLLRRFGGQGTARVTFKQAIHERDKSHTFSI